MLSELRTRNTCLDVASYLNGNDTTCVILQRVFIRHFMIHTLLSYRGSQRNTCRDVVSYLNWNDTICVAFLKK